MHNRPPPSMDAYVVLLPASASASHSLIDYLHLLFLQHGRASTTTLQPLHIRWQISVRRALHSQSAIPQTGSIHPPLHACISPPTPNPPLKLGHPPSHLSLSLTPSLPPLQAPQPPNPAQTPPHQLPSSPSNQHQHP